MLIQLISNQVKWSQIQTNLVAQLILNQATTQGKNHTTHYLVGNSQ